jgi:hypothetical protein
MSLHLPNREWSALGNKNRVFCYTRSLDRTFGVLA